MRCNRNRMRGEMLLSFQTFIWVICATKADNSCMNRELKQFLLYSLTSLCLLFPFHGGLPCRSNIHKQVHLYHPVYSRQDDPHPAAGLSPIPAVSLSPNVSPPCKASSMPLIPPQLELAPSSTTIAHGLSPVRNLIFFPAVHCLGEGRTFHSGVHLLSFPCIPLPP